MEELSAALRALQTMVSEGLLDEGTAATLRDQHVRQYSARLSVRAEESSLRTQEIRLRAAQLPTYVDAMAIAECAAVTSGRLVPAGFDAGPGAGPVHVHLPLAAAAPRTALQLQTGWPAPHAARPLALAKGGTQRLGGVASAGPLGGAVAHQPTRTVAACEPSVARSAPVPAASVSGQQPSGSGTERAAPTAAPTAHGVTEDVRTDGPMARGSGLASSHSDPSSQGVRQHITVLACQVQGRAGVSAEVLRAAMLRFHERVGERVVRAHGFVAQRLPMGMMVYFSYPRHLPSAEECACAEALAMVAALPAINAGAKPHRGDHDGVLQSVRVGVHSGLTLVGADHEARQAKHHFASGFVRRALF